MACKLGRLAARRPVGLADLAAYLKDPLPEGPARVAAPQVTDWGMLANDRLGCCTLAGVVHLRMANAAQHGETETFPTADDVIDTYLQLSGGVDSGLVEADVLATWYTAGLFGDRIAGYAPGDHRDEDELRSIVAAFGGSYLGVVIASPAQQQFAAGEPWDLTGTSADREILGGHAVPIVGYDADYAYLVTWGKTQPATWRWVSAYLEESWATITSEDARVDLAQLQADLAQLERAA